MNKPRVKMTCVYCGSDEVVCEAACRWSVEEQKWEITTIYDAKTCDSCGREFDDQPVAIAVAE